MLLIVIIFLYLGGVLVFLGIGASDPPGPNPHGAGYKRAKAGWDKLSPAKRTSLNNFVIITVTLIWPLIIPIMIYEVVVKRQLPR